MTGALCQYCARATDASNRDADGRVWCGCDRIGGALIVCPDCGGGGIKICATCGAVSGCWTCEGDGLAQKEQVLRLKGT